MYNRELGKLIPAHPGLKSVYTCSTGDVVSGAAINGNVIDREGLMHSAHGLNGLGQNDRYLTAAPILLAWQVLGSTFVGKAVSATVKLQHGDSSGGGDMADLALAGGGSPRVNNFYNTGLSTDYANWTTGAVEVYAPSDHYELGGAKRFIRAVGTLTKFSGATATEGTDTFKVKMGILFGEPTYAPPAVTSTSSSTST